MSNDKPVEILTISNDIVQGYVRAGSYSTKTWGGRFSDWFQECRRFYPLVNVTIFPKSQAASPIHLAWMLVPYHAIVMLAEGHGTIAPQRQPAACASPISIKKKI